MRRSSETKTSIGLMGRLRDPHDQGAWRTFWARYVPRIRAWARARGLADDDAEEVTSKVLEKLVVTMAEFRYDPQQRFRSWLRTEVNNAVLDLWRARARHPADHGAGGSAWLSALHVVEAEPDTAELVEDLDNDLQRQEQTLQEAIERTRARVEANTWNAFWQTAVEQCKAADVAHELGMSVVSVHVAKNRVSNLLHEEFTRSDSP
jgi:RNA polymerase sigma-70 factor (ECF subfamily)